MKKILDQIKDYEYLGEAILNGKQMVIEDSVKKTHEPFEIANTSQFPPLIEQSSIESMEEIVKMDRSYLKVIEGASTTMSETISDKHMSKKKKKAKKGVKFQEGTPPRKVSHTPGSSPPRKVSSQSSSNLKKVSTKYGSSIISFPPWK